MNPGLFTTLLLGAITVGAVHALSPDHWVPFAAVARARGWSMARTARVAAACGFGHVTVSVLLGIVGLFLGIEVLEAFGRRMQSVAGILLIGFGIAYAVWGLRHEMGKCLHGHAHGHYDHVHDPSKTTAWGLFVLSCADPCVAVVPIVFAAAPLGVASAITIVVAYEAATLGAMVALVLLARSGVKLIRMRLLDHHAHAAAGAFIAVVGIVLLVLGL